MATITDLGRPDGQGRSARWRRGRAGGPSSTRSRTSATGARSTSSCWSPAASRCVRARSGRRRHSGPGRRTSPSSSWTCLPGSRPGGVGAAARLAVGRRRAVRRSAARQAVAARPRPGPRRPARVAHRPQPRLRRRPGRQDDLADIFAADDLPTFPVISLAVVTAVVATAAPYLVRGLRRVVLIVPFVAAFAALTSPDGLPIDVLGALVLGVTVAAAVHVAFGSPEGRPTLAQVVAAAAQLGCHGRASPASRTEQPWGEVVVRGVDALRSAAGGEGARRRRRRRQAPDPGLAPAVVPRCRRERRQRPRARQPGGPRHAARASGPVSVCPTCWPSAATGSWPCSPSA